MTEVRLQDFDLLGAPCVELEIDQLADTRRLACGLLEIFPTGGFIGLLGNLGAGKTTLVQAMAEVLAPGMEARSPTFTLLNSYETRPQIVHIDLYRLETYDDLESIGYWDYIGAPGVLGCVEWVDRIPHAWPGEGVLVQIERREAARRARLWPSAAYADALVAAFDPRAARSGG